jgi:hypothetical protein
MGQQAESSTRLGRLKALAKPGHWRSAAPQTCQHIPQTGHRCRHDHELSPFYKGLQGAHTYSLLAKQVNTQAGRQGYAGQIAGIFPVLLQITHLLGITRSERHGVLNQGIGCGTDRQRCAPGTGTKHYYFHSWLSTLGLAYRYFLFKYY